MIDITIIVAAAVVAAVVYVRKTSSGVALLALLAGVLLDQLLASWIISLVPSSGVNAKTLSAIIHMVLILMPVVVAIVAAKSGHRDNIISLLTSLALGFLIVYFLQKGLVIQTLLPKAATSSLFVLVKPYQNLILAGSTLLALAEIMAGGRSKKSTGKKKKKSND